MNLLPSGAASDHTAMLHSRFGVHDNNQVELKLDYQIDSGAHWTRYQTEAFFFVPHSLGIDRSSYDQDRFFRDTQAYIRFKTPRMPLDAISDAASFESPLHEISKRVKNSSGLQNESDTGPLSQQLRMFGCLVRANLRDAVVATGQRLDEIKSQPLCSPRLFLDVVESVSRLLKSVDGICRGFRQLRSHFVAVGGPEWVRRQYGHVDEYLSVTVETYLTELLATLKRSELGDSKKVRKLSAEVESRLSAVIVREQNHRESAGYPTNLRHERGRNTYVRRSGALKKFMTSVLFLHIAPRKEGRSVLQFIAAIAAGSAMAFSMAAAFLSERIWGMNSVPFAMAIVIAYVFKDRIKDWMKGFFSSRIARWLPDRSLTVVDPETGIPVGKCRESLAYLDDKHLPSAVRAWRQSGVDPFEAEFNPEVVLHYVKDVAVRGKRIGDQRGRLRAINDIIRWNVSSLLTRMDDPQRSVEFYDPQLDEICQAICPKRYYVNIVLVLRASGRLESIQRFRVILDRGGIHKLESIDIQDAPLLSQPSSAAVRGVQALAIATPPGDAIAMASSPPTNS